MEILLYGALIVAQLGITGKQYAMKKCGSIAPGGFNSVCINLMRSLICLVVSLVIWLVMDANGTSISGNIVIIIAALGTALNLFTWILSSRKVSLLLIENVSMIGSMIVPMLLAPFIYKGEKISAIQWIGCILVFVSVFFFVNKDEGKKEGTLLSKILLVSACALGACVSSVFRKYYSFYYEEKGIGSNEYFTLLNFVTLAVVYACMFAFYYIGSMKRAKKVAGEDSAEATKLELPYKKIWKYVLLAAAALYVNELFTLYASALPSAIYFPLTRGLIILGSFILDATVFHDKITIKKIMGVVVILTAAVLVNF